MSWQSALVMTVALLMEHSIIAFAYNNHIKPEQFRFLFNGFFDELRNGLAHWGWGWGQRSPKYIIFKHLD